MADAGNAACCSTHIHDTTGNLLGKQTKPPFRYFPFQCSFVGFHLL